MDFLSIGIITSRIEIMITRPFGLNGALIVKTI